MELRRLAGEGPGGIREGERDGGWGREGNGRQGREEEREEETLIETTK